MEESNSLSLILVTDRTEQDVDLETEKGYYSDVDLTRVTKAMEYLVEELNTSGYSVDGFTKGLLWVENEIPIPEVLNTYINNVKLLRNALTILNMELPDSVDFMGYKDANDIEKLLIYVEERLVSLRRIFIRSGSFVSFAGVGYYIDRTDYSVTLYLLCDRDGVLLCDADGVQLAAG